LTEGSFKTKDVLEKRDKCLLIVASFGVFFFFLLEMGQQQQREINSFKSLIDQKLVKTGEKDKLKIKK
jgi:hypothetical protein